MHQQLNVHENDLIFVLRKMAMAWIAWGLATYAIWIYPTATVFASVLVLACAALYMMGFASTEMMLFNRGVNWWREHPGLIVFHKMNAEGEIAGSIYAAYLILGLWVRTGHLEHFHVPWNGAFTILGIMSAANLAAPALKVLMEKLEKRTNTTTAIAAGSSSSSFTGEPAMGVALPQFLGGRVNRDLIPRVAVRSAATIGHGGAALGIPFAAPPILIVWERISNPDTLGWGLMDLFLLVSIPCLVYVILVSWSMASSINSNGRHFSAIIPRDAFWLFVMMILVIGHIIDFAGIYHLSPALWALDGIVGLMNVRLMSVRYEHEIWEMCMKLGIERNSPEAQGNHDIETKEEEGFGAAYQPTLLFFLLIAFEAIGHVGAPALEVIPDVIPMTEWPLFYVIVAFYLIARVLSQLTDNAFVSLVLVQLAVTLIPTLGVTMVTLLVIAILLGALDGGSFLIISNLPNFAIARRFRMDNARWWPQAVKILPYSAIHLIWLGFLCVILT